MSPSCSCAEDKTPQSNAQCFVPCDFVSCRSYIFYLSKYYEFLDTVLLVLKKVCFVSFAFSIFGSRRLLLQATRYPALPFPFLKKLQFHATQRFHPLLSFLKEDCSFKLRNIVPSPPFPFLKENCRVKLHDIFSAPLHSRRKIGVLGCINAFPLFCLFLTHIIKWLVLEHCDVCFFLLPIASELCSYRPQLQSSYDDP